MRNLEKARYLDIIDIFSKYKDIEPNELVKIIHLKTGLINMTYNDFKNIYNQFKNSNLYNKDNNNTIHCIKITNSENINAESYCNNYISNKKSKYTTSCFNNQQNYTLNKANINNIKLKIKNELSGDILEKIIRKKKNRKYYKEMSFQEKNIDNQIDYIIQMCYINDWLVFDNNCLKSKIGDYYSNSDIIFREIMKQTTNQNKILTNKENIIVDYIMFFKIYFSKYFNIKSDNIECNLTIIILHLMKELQKKIFKTSNNQELETLVFFKNRLYNFFQCYKK